VQRPRTGSVADGGSIPPSSTEAFIPKASVGLTRFRRGGGKRADGPRGDRRNRHKAINANDDVYFVKAYG